MGKSTLLNALTEADAFHFRNLSRTGPFLAISRSFRPSVRAMPTQGSTGISVP